MIIFFDKRDNKIFGTVDGRVHDPEFAKVAMMKSSNIPAEFVGKFIVPTKPLEEIVEVPIKEQFADIKDNFKIKEKITGTKKEKRTKELAFDVPFADKIYRHEDPKDPLKLINCKVVLDKNGEIVDLLANN